MSKRLADFIEEPVWSNGEYGYQEEKELTAHEDPVRLAFQIVEVNDKRYERLLNKLASVLRIYTSVSVQVEELEIALAEEGEYVIEGKNVVVMSNLLNMLSIASPRGYYVLRKELHTSIMDEYLQAIRDCGATPNHESRKTSLRKLKDAVAKLAEEGDDPSRRESLVREVFLREYQVLLEEFIAPERYTSRLRDTFPYPIEDSKQVELEAVKGMCWLLGNYDFPLTVDQIHDTLRQLMHRILAILDSNEELVLLKSCGNLLSKVIEKCSDDSRLAILIAWRKILYELILEIKDASMKAKIYFGVKQLEDRVNIPTIGQVQQLICEELITTLRSEVLGDETRMRSIVALSTIDPSTAAEEGWKIYRSSSSNHLRVTGIWALGTHPSDTNLRRLVQLLFPPFAFMRERNIEVLEIAVASLFECQALFPSEVEVRLRQLMRDHKELAEISSAYLTWLEVGIPNLPSSPPFTGATEKMIEQYASLRSAYVPEYVNATAQEQLMIDTALYPVRALLPALVEKGGRLILATYSAAEIDPHLQGKRRRGGGFYDSVAGIASSTGKVVIRRRDLEDGSGYETLIHEMGHATHYHLEAGDRELFNAIESSYTLAVSGGYCIDTYAETNEYEYFAQGREAYSCLVRDHASLIRRYFKQRYGYEDLNATTRSWLKRKDPTLFSLVEQALLFLERQSDELICG